VLDTRDPVEFAAAHLTGSINIGLFGQYATWVGTVLTHDQPIAIVADLGAETESALRLGRIGFDRIIGYLEGGLASADSASTRIATTERWARMSRHRGWRRRHLRSSSTCAPRRRGRRNESKIASISR